MLISLVPLCLCIAGRAEHALTIEGFVKIEIKQSDVYREKGIIRTLPAEVVIQVHRVVGSHHGGSTTTYAITSSNTPFHPSRSDPIRERGSSNRRESGS